VNLLFAIGFPEQASTGHVGTVPDLANPSFCIQLAGSLHFLLCQARVLSFGETFPALRYG
jgi:hypothetical protein